MGAFGHNSQGMDLKPRRVTLAGNQLTRTIEMEFLCSDAAVKGQAPVNIRRLGLWMAMLLRPGNAHRVVSFKCSVGSRALPGVPPLPNTVVTLSPPLLPGHPAVASVTNTFGNGAPHGKWAVFALFPVTDPDPTHPKLSDPVQPNEVLYFELVIDNFVPHQGRDVHVVPMVATLPNLGFEATYFMGVSAFTTGDKTVIDDFGTTTVTMNNNPGMPNGYGPVRAPAWP
jgi:hypothetical protein